MELERVVCAQADVEADLEKVRERVALVREEERVVAQRAHGEADLLEVEEVLQRRHLAEQDAMRDRVCGEVGGGEVREERGGVCGDAGERGGETGVRERRDEWRGSKCVEDETR